MTRLALAAILALPAILAQREPLPVFVQVPAGPFVMGADRARDPQAFDNERWSPAHGEGTVHLPTFYIARHETTVEQFAAFVRATSWKVDERALAGPPAHPVTYVSWPDALAYARWLERADGTVGVISYRDLTISTRSMTSASRIRSATSRPRVISPKTV